MSLGNTVLQLFCCYYSWCLYRQFRCWIYCTFTLVLSEVCVQCPIWLFSGVPWHYCYYYYYYSIWMSLVTGLLFLVLLSNQQWSPPLRFQVSRCSTFRIMCDVPSVPSIAVFRSESIKCLPGTVSKFFLKLLVTIPVAPIITVTIVHSGYLLLLLLLLCCCCCNLVSFKYPVST